MSRVVTRSRRRWGAIAGVVAGSALLVGLAGCGFKQEEGDAVNGKQLFVEKCGTCHELARAGTKGITGPNLDQAFQQALRDGFRRDTFRGVVDKQIRFPAINGVMPNADSLGISDDEAEDIATYVSQAAAKPGKDTGLLATAGLPATSGKPAVAKGGVLEIAAAAGGLAFVTKKATATAGKLRIASENPQAIGHNIALEGAGVDEKGRVVTNGGTSEFTLTLKKGKYTFYCSVPGHREGGMEGTLTVR